jgi:hypothetical protein
MPIHYVPPTAKDLRDLKDRLGYSGREMAELFGLASSQQWHKYCGGNDQRQMSLPMLFLAGALRNRTGTVKDVFEWCREVGATIDLDAHTDSPANSGESDQ